VFDSSGAPTDGIPVELHRLDGELEAIATSAHGKVEFCDMRSGTHFLIAMKASCMPVRVDNIRPYHFFTLNLTLTVPICPHQMGAGGPSCIVTVRARTALGPLLKATVRLGNADSKTEVDRLGRMFFALKPSSSSSVTVFSEDSKAQTRLVRCPSRAEDIDEDFLFEQ